MAISMKYADMERLAQYRDSLYDHPRLTYLFFELTNTCNLSCLHCGSSACPQNNTFLPADAAKNVIDLVAARYSPHSIMICLSGGEPLIHPDFFEIASYAKKRGFSCGITTNGTLIDTDAAEKLVSCGLDSITFSLDGLQDTNDWFRNKKGSFQKCVQGIQNLLDISHGKITTQITTVIHKKNIHQLERIYDFVCRLGVDSWRVINLEPIGRALEHRELLLEPEQLYQLLLFIREKRYSASVHIDVTYGCSHYLSEEFERTVRDNYFICGSGIFAASVLCNGDIYSCMDIERRPEMVQGNIMTDNFVDVWENRFQLFRQDRTDGCEMCRQCSDRRYCRGDSSHTWDYDNNQPLLCIKQFLSAKGD